MGVKYWVLRLLVEPGAIISKVYQSTSWKVMDA